MKTFSGLKVRRGLLSSVLLWIIRLVVTGVVLGRHGGRGRGIGVFDAAAIARILDAFEIGRRGLDSLRSSLVCGAHRDWGSKGGDPQTEKGKYKDTVVHGVENSTSRPETDMSGKDNGCPELPLESFPKGEKSIMRMAIIIGLIGVALVVSAGEPQGREEGGPRLEAKICSPSWRMSVERRLVFLEDQADMLESELDEIRY